MSEGPKWTQYFDPVITAMTSSLKRREVCGSGATSLQTADLLRTVVSKGRYSSIQDLLDGIRYIGKKLTSAQPIELAIGNVVRRVLYVVRQEHAAAQEQKNVDGTPSDDADVGANIPNPVTVDLSLSLHKLLDAKDESKEDGLNTPFNSRLRGPIIDQITELMDEIKTVYLNIAEQGVEHIYEKEVILTYGISRTVAAFLKEASRFRSFEVIVAESAPAYEGQKMARELGSGDSDQKGIKTTVITDSAVFALMPHVNKVIIGCHAVMANGGVIVHTGGNNIAVAAKTHAKPVVVCTGLHKLCPMYAFDQDTFNDHNAPSQLLKFEDEQSAEVDVENPAFDYIPPDHVDLFITNFGGHNPSYVYRLLAEYYYPQDYDL